jgi:hypothetical protein
MTTKRTDAAHQAKQRTRDARCLFHPTARIRRLECLCCCPPTPHTTGAMCVCVCQRERERARARARASARERWRGGERESERERKGERVSKSVREGEKEYVSTHIYVCMYVCMYIRMHACMLTYYIYACIMQIAIEMGGTPLEHFEVSLYSDVRVCICMHASMHTQEHTLR